MKAARDDALNLIRHWYSEDTPLRCTSTTEGLGFGLTGRVAELSDSVLSIRGTACEAVITLDGASYQYHRAENIPATIQESSSDTFVSALELMLRNGDTFVMAEVRTARRRGNSHTRAVDPWTVGDGGGSVSSRCGQARSALGRGRTAAGFTIYRGAASHKWSVVEFPDGWSREQALPLKGFADSWFDTLEDARAELTRRLDGLSGKTG